ncbi:MAG: hypothetical protein ACO38I_05550 [Ilumatobacteraceae bacterium]
MRREVGAGGEPYLSLTLGAHAGLLGSCVCVPGAVSGLVDDAAGAGAGFSLEVSSPEARAWLAVFRRRVREAVKSETGLSTFLSEERPRVTCGAPRGGAAFAVASRALATRRRVCAFLRFRGVALSEERGVLVADEAWVAVAVVGEAAVEAGLPAPGPLPLRRWVPVSK